MATSGPYLDQIPQFARGRICARHARRRQAVAQKDKKIRIVSQCNPRDDGRTPLAALRIRAVAASAADLILPLSLRGGLQREGKKEKSVAHRITISASEPAHAGRRR